MEKIVIGVSDTASMKAVDWVIDRASTRVVEVTLVAAYDWTGAPFSEVAALLQTVRARIGSATPRTAVHLVESEDDPDHALAEATGHADLLVIGSHQRSRLQERFGVRSLRLARQENCATVIVPERWMPIHSGVIVVGLDDESSTSALDFAVTEAEASGARLEVVHAWTAPLPAFNPLVWVVDTEGELREAHRGRLGAVLDRLKAEHPRARVSGYLEECLPAAALRDRGKAADLIVIGSHREGPIVRAILGTAARDLLHDGSVPLCIVPARSGHDQPELVPARAKAASPGD
ncbi:MAG TPA: universal stress protein [Pseudolysinimonas sp.]|nr:universal stress protein [Pseudolysinimonas sp.]